MTGVEPGPRGQEVAAVIFQGDVNCDSAVNAVDSLQILRDVADLGTTAGCLADAGDVNCDDAVDSVDALRILRHVAGLSNTTSDGCTPVGEAIVLSPEDAAQALAQRIVHPTSLVAGVHSVEEALSRAGVASGTFEEIWVPAVEPATPEVDLPIGVLDLALEARGGTVYRMTADDVGQMLADFEWPFADGSTPGEQVVAMLTALINGAHEEPDHPVSFGPLLLDELLQLKDPSLDLTGSTPPPEDVRLSLLDLKLVSGATGPFGGQIYGLSTSQTGPGLIDAGLGAAGVSKQNAGSVGKGLAALGIAAKIWKLIEFYSTAQVNVTLDDSAKIVHKSLDTDALQLKLFKGVAGVSDEDWQEYVDSFDNISQDTNQAVRDCLNEFGLTVPADLGEIAKDAENWKIEWSIQSGFNYRNEPNAFWSIDAQLPGGSAHLGHWKTPLQKVSDYTAEAAFIVDIGTELQSDHPGPQKLDNVNVCADVDAASPPNLQTFFNATQGILGLVDAIVELGAGWLQTVAPPHACAVIGVTWHEYCALMAQSGNAAAFPAAEAQPGESVSIDALTVPDLPCEWTGTSHGSIHYYVGPYDAVGQVDAAFTFGNPQVHSNGVEYEIVSGSATWQESGHSGPCTWSKSGTEGIQGELTVLDDGSGQLMYYGWGDVIVYTQTGCPLITISARNFFNTCEDPSSLPLSGLDLSGTCQIDRPPSDFNPVTEHEEYNWHLSAESCTAPAAVTPGGTCGGP